ncbi:hypothetical protein M8J77_019835 [Diaphorina citri]|nr:hypothetical protein M8J77_019835 [Diaphorina citri]
MYYILVQVLCSIILCIGVLGNIMVPCVILKSKDMRNSTNIFLMNLSIADLMVLLVCTPTVLVEVNSKPETWQMGEHMSAASEEEEGEEEEEQEQEEEEEEPTEEKDKKDEDVGKRRRFSAETMKGQKKTGGGGGGGGENYFIFINVGQIGN